MRPPCFSFYFDICNAEEWDEIARVWFLVVDKFVGSFWVLPINVVCWQDVIAYLCGSFDSVPPKIRG